MPIRYAKFIKTPNLFKKTLDDQVLKLQKVTYKMLMVTQFIKEAKDWNQTSGDRNKMCKVKYKLSFEKY